MYKELQDKDIKKILKQSGLNNILNIQKSNVGFSNDIYFINNKYVLKVAKSSNDKSSFEREVYFCNLFENHIPTPVVVGFNTELGKFETPYIIYEKIQGDNLYNCWHKFNNQTRENIVEQICLYLKAINNTPAEEYIKKFNIDTSISWQTKILGQIEDNLTKAFNVGAIDKKAVLKVKRFVNDSKSVLNEENMALTYFDVHFDNFLIKDEKIVGMLDFERTDYLSIDYSLDIINRMVKNPAKYASKKALKYVDPKDYALIYDWVHKFYPQMFQFKDLQTRLHLYSLEYNLKLLCSFPKSATVRSEIKEIIGEF